MVSVGLWRKDECLQGCLSDDLSLPFDQLKGDFQFFWFFFSSRTLIGGVSLTQKNKYAALIFEQSHLSECAFVLFHELSVYVFCAFS